MTGWRVKLAQVAFLSVAVFAVLVAVRTRWRWAEEDNALRAEVDRLRAAERQAASRDLSEAREHDRLCTAVQAGSWLERSWRAPVVPDLDGARHEQLQLEASAVQDNEAGRCLLSGDRWELRMREIGREHGWLPPEQGGTP